jgi:hypothetical protein
MMTNLNHRMETPQVSVEVELALPNPRAIMEEDLEVMLAVKEVQIMTPAHN